MRIIILMRAVAVATGLLSTLPFFPLAAFATSADYRLEALNPRLPIGMQAGARVKVTRSTDSKGNLRLVLLTSQNPPKGRDMRTDDPMKTIRFDGMPAVPANMPSTELKIVVPADLAAGSYDVAVRVEMLGPDNRTVVASAVTPARRIPASK